MLLHEFVQNGDGVQVPADDFIALRVQAPGGELAVISDDELVGEAVFQHVFVVVHIVVGEDEGLFALG